MQSEQPAPLPPRYYQHNFEILCRTVRVQYEDLLALREREFFAAYEAASGEARCLLLRLLSRRGPLFRKELLEYPEIGGLDAPVSELLALGLLEQIETPPVDALLAVLRKPELLQICAAMGAGQDVSASSRRAELLSYLQGGPDDEVLEGWRRWRPPGHVLLAPTCGDCLAVLKLLFFGNPYQGLTEFILSDLGVVRYPDYPLDRNHRLFRRRADLDRYLELLALRERFDEACEAGCEGRLEALVEPLASAADAARDAAPVVTERADRLLLRVARQLERQERPEAALDLYRRCRAHPARERRARLLAARGDHNAALALCETMAREPWCEAERDFLRRQLPRLRRGLGRPAASVPRDRFPEERLLLERSGSVELAAAGHYAAGWERVGYVENALVCASFGLAFWRQIFAGCPGAFVNPFQSAPLDMFSGQFYRRRRAAIEARFEELSRIDLAAELLAARQRWFGISNRWVAWSAVAGDLLEQALRVVPRAHWLSLWRRLLFDPASNRNGLPDLIALDSRRGFCFIEVKGPGDALQLNQRRWLRWFQQQGIPFRVARVEWRDG